MDRLNNIDYNEIADFYWNIISTIYKEINKGTHEPYWNKESKSMIYSDEYLNAYGYLQRAEWRYDDIKEMKDYYNEDYFYFFGLENLSSIRHRIEHYLEDTTFQFPQEVYDYKKYDELIIDLYGPIRLNINNINSKHYNYYYNILHKQVMADTIKCDIKWLKGDLIELCEMLCDKEYIRTVDKKRLEKLENIIDSCKDYIFEMTSKDYEKEDKVYEGE